MSSESPTGYNAAADLIERNLIAGRGAKTAFIDDRGQYSYAELAERVSRFASVVRQLGIHPEQRILLCLYDSPARNVRLALVRRRLSSAIGDARPHAAPDRPALVRKALCRRRCRDMSSRAS